MEYRLRKAGVEIRDIGNARKMELLKINSVSAEFDGFKNLMITFLSHYKNGLYSPGQIRDKINQLKTEYEKGYALDFWRIFSSFMRAYTGFLDDAQAIDFADMINEATRTVREIPECALGYKYILLDEVQDLSKNRYHLVKEILIKNPECRLFAVGDDWQSIYRFTGSDLSLVYDFEKNFGRHTYKSLIETTHRFGAPTTNISSNFIEANPSQSHKRVFCSDKTKKTPIRIFMNDDGVRRNDSGGFMRAIMQLISEVGYEKLSTKELQIISRYNHDIRRLEAENIIIDGERII